MWIYTPNIALNTCTCDGFWADSGENRSLRLRYGERVESIDFDCPENAHRAFDAVMNGVTGGHRSLFLRERSDGTLECEYDRDYATDIEYADSTKAIVRDPRRGPSAAAVQRDAAVAAAMRGNRGMKS